MSNKATPAFPIVGTHEDVIAAGMTLRDYFAAKAIGFIQEQPKMGGFAADELARYAYALADAMMKEREL